MLGLSLAMTLGNPALNAGVGVPPSGYVFLKGQAPAATYTILRGQVSTGVYVNLAGKAA
jgi:hypothetical protein